MINFSLRTGINLFVSIAILTLGACSSSRNLVYLEDLKGTAESKTQILNKPALRIRPGDLLTIRVSSLSPEASVLFNNGVLSATSSTNPTDATTVNNAVTNKRQDEGYAVDQKGNINFSVIGRIKLADLTLEEATQTMTKAIKKYIKAPIVDIRLVNFRVTVMGEVHKPASFIVANESVNVLEALALAGDMTEFGKPENVLIIRERAGERVTVRLNLHSKAFFDSPYFYLQQNDIVYVEPDNRTKVAQTNPNNRYIALWGAVISTLGYALISLRLL